MTAPSLSSACTQFRPEQLELSTGTPLGSGAISHVVQCRLHSAASPLLPVVVKIVSKLQVLQQGKVQSVMNEKAALQRLGPHPYIARLYGTSQSPDELYYVLEWLPHGDLLQHIRRVHMERVQEYNSDKSAATATTRAAPIPSSSRALRCLDFHDIQLITAQLIVALSHASAKGVVLRDLKPENVAFDEKYRACLLDFDTVDLNGAAVVPETNNGVACPPPRTCVTGVVEGETGSQRDHNRANSPANVSQASPAAAASPPAPPSRRRLTVSEIQAMRKKSASFCGTAQYVSPEMVGECKWSFSSDLWALGALVYEMAYGTHLFAGMSQFDVLKKVIQGDYIQNGDLFPAIDFGEQASNKDNGSTVGQGNFGVLVDFVQQLLNIDPSKRLGVNKDSHKFDEAALRGHAMFRGFSWEKIDEQLHTFCARTFPVSSSSVTTSAQREASCERSALNTASGQRGADNEANSADDVSSAAAAAAAKTALEALEVASIDPSPSLAILYHIKPFNDPSYAEYVYKATADANFFEKFFFDTAKEAEQNKKDELTSDTSSPSAPPAGKVCPPSRQDVKSDAATARTQAAAQSSDDFNADVHPTADDDDDDNVIDDVGLHYTGYHAHPDFQE